MNTVCVRLFRSVFVQDKELNKYGMSTRKNALTQQKGSGQNQNMRWMENTLLMAILNGFKKQQTGFRALNTSICEQK